MRSAGAAPVAWQRRRRPLARAAAAALPAAALPSPAHVAPGQACMRVRVLQPMHRPAQSLPAADAHLRRRLHDQALPLRRRSVLCGACRRGQRRDLGLVCGVERAGGELGAPERCGLPIIRGELTVPLLRGACLRYLCRRHGVDDHVRGALCCACLGSCQAACRRLCIELWWRGHLTRRRRVHGGAVHTAWLLILQTGARRDLGLYYRLGWYYSWIPACVTMLPPVPVVLDPSVRRSLAAAAGESCFYWPGGESSSISTSSST